MPDALARIRALLIDHPEGGDLRKFLPAIAADATDRALQLRAAVASTLVAGLELAREGVLRMQQGADFGTVMVAAVPNREESEPTAT